MRTLLLICLLVFGSAAAVTVFADESAFDELSHAVKKKTVEKMASAKPATAKDAKVKSDCSSKTEKTADCKKDESEKH